MRWLNGKHGRGGTGCALFQKIPTSPKGLCNVMIAVAPAVSPVKIAVGMLTKITQMVEGVLTEIAINRFLPTTLPCIAVMNARLMTHDGRANRLATGTLC